MSLYPYLYLVDYLCQCLYFIVYKHASSTIKGNLFLHKGQTCQHLRLLQPWISLFFLLLKKKKYKKETCNLNITSATYTWTFRYKKKWVHYKYLFLIYSLSTTLIIFFPIIVGVLYMSKKQCLKFFFSYHKKLMGISYNQS